MMGGKHPLIHMQRYSVVLHTFEDAKTHHLFVWGYGPRSAEAGARELLQKPVFGYDDEQAEAADLRECVVSPPPRPGHDWS